jgi:dolichyl-phosphate beta-glucosyltransferase
MNTFISIVIPAYNESARLGNPIHQILSFIQRENLKAELIVVDDGSGDKTTEVAEKAFVEFPGLESRVIRYEPNRGKGFAVKTGFLAAKGEIALFSDADLSTPIEELYKLVKPLQDDEYDITFGSRALDRSLTGTHQPWHREQSGKVFNLIMRMLTGLPFWDTQCGFKAFNMKKFRPLLDLMTIDRFGFDVEFLFVAFHKGLRLKEIPVRWNDVEGSKISFRTGLDGFREVYQISRNARKGVYGEK